MLVACMLFESELKLDSALIHKKLIQYWLEWHEWIKSAVETILSIGVITEYFADLWIHLYKIVIVLGREDQSA